MSELARLFIRRDVVGLEEANQTSLREELAAIEDGGYLVADIEKAFTPYYRIVSMILGWAELQRVFAHIGKEPRAHVLEEMAHMITDELPGSADRSLFPETLPADLQWVEKAKKSPQDYALLVGQTSIPLAEREIAKEATGRFINEKFGETEIPDEVWANDSLNTGIVLATSNTRRQRNLLDKTKQLLNQKPDLLLQTVELLPVEAMLKFDAK